MIPSKAKIATPNPRLPTPSPRFFTNMANSIKHLKGEQMLFNSHQNSLEYSHPPLPEEPSGLYDTLITDSDMALTKRKFVKVQSTGAVEMEPDEVEFCVKITTNKLDAAQAKESVKKRKDFVLASLKKFKIPDNIPVYSIAKRPPLMNNRGAGPTDQRSKRREDEPNGNNVKNEEEFVNAKKELIYAEELCIKCSSLMQYLNVFSICNEKLDKHVEVSRPVVRFSPQCVQTYTQKAVRLAMANGIQKASDLISSTKQRVSLGRLYYSVEDSLVVEPVLEYENHDNFETFSWKRLNKTVTCSLSSVFELEHNRIRKLV